MRIFLIFLLFSTLCGCAIKGILGQFLQVKLAVLLMKLQYQIKNSGYPGVRSWSWIATCKGERFICTSSWHRRTFKSNKLFTTKINGKKTKNFLIKKY